jgi:hypothetical protein
MLCDTNILLDFVRNMAKNSSIHTLPTKYKQTNEDPSCLTLNHNTRLRSQNKISYRLLDKVKVFVLVVEILLQVGHEVRLGDHNY